MHQSFSATQSVWARSCKELKQNFLANKNPLSNHSEITDSKDSIVSVQPIKKNPLIYVIQVAQSVY